MNADPKVPGLAARRSPRLRRLGLAAVAVAALFVVAGRACAGWDDFEFAQKLIEKGYIEYARRVLDRMMADEKRPQADHDRARYGLALLGKAELIAAYRDPKTPWTQVVEKMKAALASIEDFAAKNEKDAKADEARFESGSLRRWFVERASELAQDKDALAARGAKADDVLKLAQDQIQAAIETYDNLRKNAKRDQDKQIANFQFVTANYYKGLVYPKCSPEAVAAFKNARTILDNYAYDNDGYLTGVFAQDFTGLTLQELADCESDADRRWKGYNDALQAFVACADTEDQGDEYRRIIAQGYLHVGQLANHLAGDEGGEVTETKARDLLKEARKHLAQMTQHAPRAPKIEAGILALVEWGLIEWRLDNAGEAIQILKRASDYAQAGAFDAARARANAALARVVAGGSTSAGAADPGVVMKVGEDLFGRGKYPEAVAAYQKVILAAPKTAEGLRTYVYPSWARIGQCYVNQKLLVEAATAYDVIVDEVRAGRIVGAGEGDKTTRLAMDAMERERALLRELSDKTGDPTVRDRFNRFTDEYINVLSKRLGTSDTGSDLAYRRARDLFDGGRKAKDEGQPADVWRKSLADSRPFFLETAKSLKSEYQDAAWVYLCRVAYELADWDGVAKAADDALAYWETPESKKRAETEEKVGAAREGQRAAVTYWKAAALREAKRDDDALALLDSFLKQFGKTAGEFYRGQALGLRVEILADKDRIQEAEDALTVLFREAPDYHRMGAILLKVAARYQEKVTELQKKIDAVELERLGPPDDRSQGVKSRLLAAEKREQNLIGVLSDLNATIRRLELFIEKGDPEKKKEKEIAAEELKKRRVERADTQEKLAKIREEIASLGARRDALLAQKAALEKEQVAPLRRSADLYRRLDEVVKDLDAKAAPTEKKRRRPDNVSALAYRYYRLARLEPDVLADWTTARDLYEDFLAFPETKALPDTNAGKRATMRNLGDIYYHLAVQAKTPEEARTAYANAVKYLQPGLARNPPNVPILVSLVSGELAVLPYTDPVSDRRWRIPVRKVTDVAAFKEYVKDLGGDRLPKYANDRTDGDYQKAVRAFQKEIAGSSDEQVQRIVASLKDAGFDPAFYGEHGDTSPEFLMPLAYSYVRSGVAENYLRAANVALAVLKSPPQAEDDSAEWWEARTIQMEALISMAERAAASAGPESAEAKTRAQEADRNMASTKQLYPRIGGPERAEQTLKEWKALQTRLQALMGRLGLTPSAVDLEAMPKEAPAEPAPGEPAPAAPAPPAMGEPAGMDK